jgi:hypothetical protein
MQVNGEPDPSIALPELLPPSELDASVLDLAMAEFEQSAADEPAPQRTPAVSGFEVFVHGAIAFAYLVYAANAAIDLLERVAF